MFNFPDPTREEEIAELTPREREDIARRGLAGVLALVVTVVLIGLWVFFATNGDPAAENAAVRDAVVADLASVGVDAEFVEEVDGPAVGDRYRVQNSCGGSRRMIFARVSDDLLIARVNGDVFEVTPDSTERLTFC